MDSLYFLRHCPHTFLHFFMVFFSFLKYIYIRCFEVFFLLSLTFGFSQRQFLLSTLFQYKGHTQFHCMFHNFGLKPRHFRKHTVVNLYVDPLKLVGFFFSNMVYHFNDIYFFPQCSTSDVTTQRVKPWVCA